MLLYYVTPENRILYKIDPKGTFSQSPKVLKNPLNFFKKKVLVLGKEWVYSLRKRYPVLSEKELSKAISYEVKDLFPLKEPEYLFWITKKGETFTEVSLFSWEKFLTEEIRKEFPFTHVLPEELLFTSKELGLFFLKRGDRVLITASENHTFLNSFYLRYPFLTEEIELFVKTLRSRLTEVKKVFLYGFSEKEVLPIFPAELKPLLSFRPSLEADLPLFLERLSLKNFKVKQPLTFNLEGLLIRAGRIFLVIIIAFQANLMFSYWEYERAIRNIKKELKTLDQELKEKVVPFTKREVHNGTLDQETLQAFRELEEEWSSYKKNSISDTLIILEEIAKMLPDGSKIIHFNLKEKKLEVFLEAKDLFEILTNFKKSSYFSEVKLTGSPIVDPRTKVYRFRLEVALR